MSGAGLTSGLEITTGYPPLAFGLAIVKPRLQLDDYSPIHAPWGTTVLPVSPGSHRLECWFTWGLFTGAGHATLDVHVPDRALVRVRYQAPTWFVFTKGKWTHGETASVSASGAGWHADPSGRHTLRYWDGAAWTSHVSTNGVASTDQPG